MVSVERGNVEELLGGEPLAQQVYDALVGLVDDLGPATVQVTRSQVAFRRRRGFCWVWLPHHLEVHDLSDVDDEVAGWLAEAYEAAG